MDQPSVDIQLPGKIAVAFCGPYVMIGRSNGASEGKCKTPRESERDPQPLSMSALQILWTFSIYLEAVAILPQLVLLQRTQNIDNLTGNYVFLLG